MRNFVIAPQKTKQTPENMVHCSEDTHKKKNADKIPWYLDKQIVQPVFPPQQLE